MSKKTRNILVDGHTIDELIEIFKDKRETREIYVNSALVNPDFAQIIKALECYREQLNSEKMSEILDKELKMLYPEPAYRLFVDMDGTLTEFIPQLSTAPLYEKGYFRNLPPQEKVVEAIKRIIFDHPYEIEVFVNTAYLVDSKWAFQEKMDWLDEHLPEVDINHRIFIPCGENKKDYIVGFNEERDVLLDDYTHNLLKWSPGRGIKLLNGINHSKGTWKGDMVSAEREPDELALAIVYAVKEEHRIFDTYDKLMDFRPQQRYYPEEAPLPFY